MRSSRGVLPPDVVQHLRALADGYLDNPNPLSREAEMVYGTEVLRNTQSLDPFFSEFLVRQPFLSLAEAIVGPNPGFCGQNVIRSQRGQGISLWHVDDTVEIPLPADVPRHDARLQLPVVWFS